MVGNLPGHCKRRISPDRLRWYHYTNGARTLTTKVKSNAGNTPTAKHSRRGFRAGIVADAKMLRGLLIDRIDSVIVRGRTKIILDDLEESLGVAGYKRDEVYAAILEDLFPEEFLPPEKLTRHVRGIVPRTGGRGASRKRIRALIAQLKKSAAPRSETGDHAIQVSA